MLRQHLTSGLSLIRHRAVLCFVAVVMLFSFTLSITASAQVNAQSGGFGQGVATCAIESVGWVICPVMRTIATLADYSFAFINENYLRIEYNLTGGRSGIFIAWELVRNIANVVFVLAFLYIVYTQITGRNTGDFNLKRILPRLIIGAILVNVSYYICAAAVQLSNIVGSAILTLMVDTAHRIGTPAMSLNNAASGFKDGILLDLVSNMLTKSGVVWVMLAPMAAVTIGIATVSGIALILLIARKVVVSMLVLVSPLLFVAYMLPNLERFFQQWLRLFVQLLLLYPVVAFLLGTGQIVSATIINVGGESNYRVQGDSYRSKTGGSGSAGTDLSAAGAAVLPLVGVWWMMKGMSAVMSSAGTRLSAGVGRGAKARERAEKMQAKFGKSGAPPSVGSVNITGGRVNVYNRKPAFTRASGRRRHATPGGSSLPPMPKRDGLGRKAPQNELGSSLDSLLNNGVKEQNRAAEQAAAQIEQAQAAAIDGVAAAATVQAQQAQQTQQTQAQQAQAQAQAQVVEAAASDKDMKKSANEAFKNLNQRQKPQGKDAERSFGTAQPTAGGGGGNGQAAPSVSNHSNDYRAPAIAQTMTVPQQQTQTSQRIIVGGVQSVDASTLLNNPAEMARVTSQNYQAPEGELQKLATGRANKYMFDSARDIDEAARKLDNLNKKHDDDEQPQQQDEAPKPEDK